MKIRLDKLLVERGLLPTRERAQAMILAGRVLVEEQKIEKPGNAFEDSVAVRLLGEDLRYVSRGGLKLEEALRYWNIDLNGRFCVDIGTSTGGFTDCMLQHGAARVLCVDTGYGQIAETLRRDPRVTLMERTNARKLMPGDLPAEIELYRWMYLLSRPHWFCLPWWEPSRGAAKFEASGSRHLVKPQFEAGRQHVGKAASSATRRPIAWLSSAFVPALRRWVEPASKSSTRRFTEPKATANFFSTPAGLKE